MEFCASWCASWCAGAEDPRDADLAPDAPEAPDVLIMRPTEVLDSGDWDKLYQTFRDKLSQQQGGLQGLAKVSRAAEIAVKAVPMPGVDVISSMLGWLSSDAESEANARQAAQNEALRMPLQVEGMLHRLQNTMTSPGMRSTRNFYSKKLSETLLVLRHCLEKRDSSNFQECCIQIQELDDQLVRAIASVQANKNIENHRNCSPTMPTRDYRMKRLRGEVSDYVGLEDDVVNIKKKILSGQTTVGLVALKAMGGIGKTTLASAVCDDDEINKAFGHICWVEVKEDPDICKLQEDLCRQLGHKVTVTDRTKGEMQLRTYLQTKKVLLVLDNIWNFEDSPCDVKDLESGCLLLTTRNAQVARRAGVSKDNIVELDLKSPEMSLALLRNSAGLPCNSAGLQGNPISPELDALLLSVAVDWCGRLPLALDVVGAQARESGHSGDLWWWNDKVESWRSNTSAVGEAVEKSRQDCLLRQSYDAASPQEQVVFLWLVSLRHLREANLMICGRLCEAVAALLGVTEGVAFYTLEGLANRSLARWTSNVNVRLMSAREAHEDIFIHDLLRDMANRVMKGAVVGEALHVMIGCQEQLHWQGWERGADSISSLWLSSYGDASNFLPKIVLLRHLRVLGVRGRWSQTHGSLSFGSRNGILSQLSALTNLTYLSLVANRLRGSIPEELAALTNLTYLNLSANQLSDSIPPQLSALTKLTEFSLFRNQLSGSIPTELSALTNLRVLNLASNNLSGRIPQQLFTLTNLTVLKLTLGGSIPTELSALTNLRVLYILDGQSYRIPPQLSALTNLEVLYAPPKLGRISRQFLALTKNFSYFNFTEIALFRSQLSGSIPPQFSALTSLGVLDLSDNQLSGSIPTELSALTNLRVLCLAPRSRSVLAFSAALRFGRNRH